MRTSDAILSWQPNEADLYNKRQLWLESVWEDLGLSKSEMEFWQERETQIKTPYVYQHHEAYLTLTSCFQTVGVFVLLLIPICLTGVFSEEHTRKTDQIILCSALGKTKIYWAKIMAGISFAVISAIILSLFTFIMVICLHGADGSQAVFQLIYKISSDPITCGQAIRIMYGNMIFAAILTAIIVAIISYGDIIFVVSCGIYFLLFLSLIPAPLIYFSALNTLLEEHQIILLHYFTFLLNPHR